MASSQPATSLNVVFGMSLVISLALELANCMMPRPPPPWTWFIRKMKRKTISANGSSVARIEPSRLGWGFSEFAFSIVPSSTCSSTRLTRPSCWPWIQWASTLSPPPRSIPWSRVAFISWSPSMKVISLTWPAEMYCRIWRSGSRRTRRSG